MQKIFLVNTCADSEKYFW